MSGPAPLSSDASDTCPHCQKPAALCVCASVTPIDNRIFVLILQHPQEQDRTLGTAALAALHFRHSAVKIGLSWPSLSRLMGRTVEPQRWAIAYLGSAKGATALPGADVVLIDSKGTALPQQNFKGLEGLILLDGTWSQAKALWWRNPWMLKCRRVVLSPQRPSLYGRVRREPRRDALATIEAAGLLMARLEGRPEIEAALFSSFERMLTKFRAARSASVTEAAKR